MKRTFIIISVVLFICIIPLSTIAGQEKKSEQKIKIVVADDSGTKVILDTLIKNSQKTDSIRLKDGNVFYIYRSGDNSALIPHEGAQHFYVSVSNDEKDTEKEVREITIVCSDSAVSKDAESHKKMYVYSDSKKPGVNTGVKYKVITKTSVDEGGKEEKIIYIDDSGDSEKRTEKTFNYAVKDDLDESSVEKTRYIIAKDGLVVTVEGSDEAKTKELIRQIENNLGIRKEGAEKKESMETKTKKRVRN